MGIQPAAVRLPCIRLSVSALSSRSSSGSAFTNGTSTLITFTGQTTTANLPSLSNYKAVGTGNTSNVRNPVFSYVTNGSNQQTLVMNDTGTDATPEPGTLPLLALVGLPAVTGIMTAGKRRRSQPS